MKFPMDGNVADQGGYALRLGLEDGIVKSLLGASRKQSQAGTKVLQQLCLWQRIKELYLLRPRQLAMHAFQQLRLAPAPPHNPQDPPPLGPTALELGNASKDSR